MIGARTALSASWAGVIQRAVGKAQTAGLRPVVFGMKNAEGVFPSLPARRELEKGEKLMKNGLLSPTLSSFFGEEREKASAAAPQAATLKVQSCRGSRNRAPWK